eukprot:gb/GEZN01004068.1/.p1 GENE.gb/GEZN01004068.1/~~gb/GEZN01004068.1/.p1  ORF type:complete len:552 (+),score=86.71 gb/GEZN01004068.1/:217-1872(+)
MLSNKWQTCLAPVIAVLPDAAQYLGQDRPEGIFPLRELTFRALEANDPINFKVIIFGEMPYPRIESATGIALFDGKFRDWKNMGRCVSLREMIKSACMWKYGLSIKSNAEDVRACITEHKVVQPTEWFQATLVQGCLWLNTALTMGGPYSKGQHFKFWKPIIHAIIREILASKQGKTGQGCVFALWGRKAQELRPMLEALSKETGVEVRFTEGWNPAAGAYSKAADFCANDNYGEINKGLKELKMEPIDWAPEEGWKSTAFSVGTADSETASKKQAKGKAKGQGKAEKIEKQTSEQLEQRATLAAKMGDFMEETLDLHKMFLDRLAEVGKEGGVELEGIQGISDVPLESLKNATKPLLERIPSLSDFVERALANNPCKKKTFSTPGVTAKSLSKDECAALYLYTMESHFYRDLNASLREAKRDLVRPFFPYLRLLLTAIHNLKSHSIELWRGVRLNLKDLYPKGSTIVWWGISSCSPKRSVAEGFMGFSGERTLFQILPKTAVSIMPLSAFQSEEEYVLAPGTQLFVDSVTTASGLTTVILREKDITKLVR